MLLKRSQHRATLPANLNSHQVLYTSELIHHLVSEFISPLLEAKPQYQTVQIFLDQVDQMKVQLKQAQAQRKFKSATELRGVGSQDGEIARDGSSQVKQRVFQNRRRQMLRFRNLVMWYYETIENPDLTMTQLSSQQAAARRLAKIINLRINRFEKLSYAESTAEFQHFIEAIEADPHAMTDITLMGLNEIYEKLKTLQNRFITESLLNAQQDSENEQRPKIKTSERDLRLAVQRLLSQLHNDVASGDPTFAAVLGQIDELMDKEHSIAARRGTLRLLKQQAGTGASPDEPISDVDVQDSVDQMQGSGMQDDSKQDESKQEDIKPLDIADTVSDSIDLMDADSEINLLG